MIYFPHIPKVGGQTLKRIFTINLEAKNCIAIYNKQFGADFTAEEFPSLAANVLDENLAVYGHLKIATAFKNKKMEELRKRGNLLILAAVRDPVDRIISLFNYIRVNEEHRRHYELIGLGLEGFLQFCKNQPSNFQYDFLKKSDIDTVDSILDNNIVFSIFDSIKGFSSVLSLLSGLPEIEYKKANVTSDKHSTNLTLYKRNDLPAYLLADIVKANHQDYELYEKSKSNFEGNILRAREWVECNADFVNKIRNLNKLYLSEFLAKFKFDITSGVTLPKEYVDEFKDMGVKFEKHGDIKTAEKLMSLAFEARPTGPFIKQKMEDYRLILNKVK
jgi:hypothetical protein